ncbi:MAG: hypothetical protein ACI33P_02905, partial [Lysinibacillus sp.]
MAHNYYDAAACRTRNCLTIKNSGAFQLNDRIKESIRFNRGRVCMKNLLSMEHLTNEEILHIL